MYNDDDFGDGIISSVDELLSSSFNEEYGTYSDGDDDFYEKSADFTLEKIEINEDYEIGESALDFDEQSEPKIKIHKMLYKKVGGKFKPAGEENAK